MYALVLLLVIVASSGGNAEVTRTAEIVDFEVGGSQITFTLDGFSLDEIEHLKCVVRFHDGRESIEIEAAVTSDALNAICRLTPDINVGGVDVDLEVATMSSDTSIVAARTLFINPIAQTELKVVENWNANELTLTWNPDYFAPFFNPGATFVMQLMVYVASSFQGDFKASQIVQVVGQNIGSATVTVSSLNVARFLSIQFPYFYVLRAVGTQSDVYSSSYIFAPTVGMDESTAGRTCSKWLSFANASATPEEIHKCPSTLCQVQIDSNFVLSEYPPQIVELANGALNNHVLYYERVPTHSGYAQSCSYNQLTGHLATASPAQASWINFVSKHISYMDNYFSDVWPYMICCLQSNSQSYCDLFHQKRPIDTGHEYPGGECPCLGAGDPHMVTFESVYYDFMGYGEFWLIHGPEGSDFGVQGRMGPIWEWQTASYFKAVAIREGNTTLQIELRGGKLIVILDGKELQFKQLPASLPLERISLDINTNRAEVRTQTGFSIIFEGWGETGNVYGRAAQHNKGKGFMGIFGNFDDNPNNDLTSRDGFVIPPENIRDLSLLHHRFGMTWLVNRTESFFVYEDGKSWDDFVNIDFGPTDQYPDPATLPEEVRAICGDSLFCLYEYVVTGDLEMAVGIARIETEYEELKEELGRTIPMCDMLSEPANGRVHVNGYFDGSSATYSCDSEYDFDSGDSVRTCSVVEEFTQWTGVEPVCIWTCKTCLESTEFELTHNPSDCSKFFLCSFGQRLSLDCPRSQFFNPETLSCSNDYICLNPPGC